VLQIIAREVDKGERKRTAVEVSKADWTMSKPEVHLSPGGKRS
jgi:hypothetical protein